MINLDMDSMDKLSRRDFLHFFGLGIAGLMLPGKWITGQGSALLDDRSGLLLGRVTQQAHPLHRAPHAESEILREMDKDSLWKITNVTVSNEEISANRIWYELDGVGYAHSRRIQPVRRVFNDANTVIPEDGCLGEITVPFVDAYNKLGEGRSIAYRFYYASTFWILKRLVDNEGSVWYQLLDDRDYRVFYIPAYFMRLVPDAELRPISPEVPSEEKRVEVDLASQSLMAYEGEKIVFMSRISSGVRLPEGGFATPKGYYRTYRKRPCRHMANPANAYGSGFDLPGVPWVSYFTSDGVAFHGAYWHNDFGVPHSHGCINMTPLTAKWLYRWTPPAVPPENYYFADPDGTRVIIR